MGRHSSGGLWHPDAVEGTVVRRKPSPPADTDLIRLVWITFKQRQDKLEEFALSLNDVDVQCSLVPSDPEPVARYLAAATMPLPYFPSITGDGKVVVPEPQRKQLERALETVADVISISRRTPAFISAIGSGSVYLNPRSEAARSWLQRADDFAHPTLTVGALDVWSPIDPTGVSNS